ncbi:hypothetical protein [Mucilaginibacter lacusdianchii]|uniref:hypothetical protein n=1 Tax=Mucilaginibacter lacusdianchii TaxID=2684211 RepID=UPI00131BD2DE|nr:hypothetical protein [Mucilaginibacter sp. JXJ CY 39]
MKTQFSSFKSLLGGLEQISADDHGKIVGGFMSISGNTEPGGGETNFLAGCDTTTNNCNGGNCTAGCGTVKN